MKKRRQKQTGRKIQREGNRETSAERIGQTDTKGDRKKQEVKETGREKKEGKKKEGKNQINSLDSVLLKIKIKFPLFLVFFTQAAHFDYKNLAHIFSE